MASGGDTVKVAVRVRPFNSREKESRLIIDMNGAETTIIDPNNPEQKKTFTFDFSYWSHDGFMEDTNGYFVPIDEKYASQQRVFNDLGTSVLANAWEGFNVSLFAYGQTGSGKSYSMVGYGPNKGIIPLSCEEMFRRISENQDMYKKYQVSVSMLEIYNEKIRDLLNSKSNPSGGLKLKQDPKSGFYVEQLQQVPVTTYREIERQMEVGAKNRTIAATNMNLTSSRAHTVFTIMFSIVTETALGTSEITSKINLVDLAGSERAESTGATGDRLKEGCAINQSLSALGNVIAALADASTGKKGIFIPYRNSVLTRMLQDALGGNSKTIMIAALSPADLNFDETLSTLRYADRAKRIKNSAKKNENPTEKLIRELKEENERLRALVSNNTRPSSPETKIVLDEEQIERIKKQYEEQLRANEREMQEKQRAWEKLLADAKKRSAEENIAQGRSDTVEIERKTLPHLVNLNEDPLISETLVHILRPGRTTVGRKDAKPEPDVILAGVSIQRQHCCFDNLNGVVTAVSLPKGKVLVNGRPIEGKQQLAHDDRVIIGSTHVFRYADPVEASKQKTQREESGTTSSLQVIDWEFAQRELASSQALNDEFNMKSKAMEEEERRRQELFANQLKRLDEEMQKQRAANEEEKRHLQQILQESLKRMAEKDQDLARQEFERRQKELEAKARGLEDELRRQKDQQRLLEEASAKRQREMRVIEDILGRTVPLVNEVNMMSDEMQRGLFFEVRLLENIPDVCFSAQMAHQHKRIDVKVAVIHELSRVTWMWDLEKFDNRLHLIRDMYNRFVDEGAWVFSKEEDPMWDPPERLLIGKALTYLQPLAFMLDIKDSTPIVDHKGHRVGTVSLEISPCDADGKQVTESADFYIDDPQELVGRRLDFDVNIPRLLNLPPESSKDVQIEFRWWLDEKLHRSEPVRERTPNPEINFRRMFPIYPATPDFIRYLQNEAITFKVFGLPIEVEPNPLPALSARGRSRPTSVETQRKAQSRSNSLERGRFRHHSPTSTSPGSSPPPPGAGTFSVQGNAEVLSFNGTSTTGSIPSVWNNTLLSTSSTIANGTLNLQSVEEITSLQAELTELRKVLQAEKTYNGELQKRHVAQVDAMQKELASVKLALEASRISLEQVRRELAQTRREKEELELMMTKRKVQEDSAKTSVPGPEELERLRKESERKRLDLERAKVEADKAKVEIALTRTEAERKKAEIEEAKAETERKRAEIASTKAQAELKRIDLELGKASQDDKDRLLKARADTQTKLDIAEKVKAQWEGVRAAAASKRSDASLKKAGFELQKSDVEKLLQSMGGSMSRKGSFDRSKSESQKSDSVLPSVGSSSTLTRKNSFDRMKPELLDKDKMPQIGARSGSVTKKVSQPSPPKAPSRPTS